MRTWDGNMSRGQAEQERKKVVDYIRTQATVLSYVLLAGKEENEGCPAGSQNVRGEKERVL